MNGTVINRGATLIAPKATGAAPRRFSSARPRMGALPVMAAFALGMFTLSAPVSAKNTKNVKTGTVVIEPLTLSKTRDMDFGSVAPPDAGTVVMTYDQNTGSACVASAGLVRAGTCDAAEFVGYGSANQRVRITLPVDQEVTLTGPGQDMLVSDMDIFFGLGLTQTNNSNSATNRQYRISSADGGFFFRVGGTLNVNANQAPGVYDGVFTMIVDYK